VPRALILVLLGLLTLLSASAQDGENTPVWSLVGPSGPVVPGQPFTVSARVSLPPGYYQDADSTFLSFEPLPPVRVVGRSTSSATIRGTKASFTGTFTLYRTLVLPETGSDRPKEITFSLGWQICRVDGICLLPAQTTKTVPITIQTSGPGIDFWSALLGAFLGGLFLNLMPCVFPVLALKALGIASASGLSRRDQRRDALASAAGSFGVILALGGATALMAALGQRLDWGFPFQQPVFVWALTLGFWALALQLGGLWTWSWSPFSLSAPGRGVLRSLTGGIFLVVAATPCTAPVLGPALGFALARPPAEIPLYFASIGLGLVAPLLVLQAFPHWGRLLPQPGRWMVWVERVAGVFLAATVGYLLWIFLVQNGADRTEWAAGLLVLAAVGLALRGRSMPWAQPVSTLVLVLVLAGSIFVVQSPTTQHNSVVKSSEGWRPFSKNALEQALSEGKPVLVDATAAWCATCQVNELAVLGRPEVRQRMDQWGIVRLRADYTRPDPAIQTWLASVNRAGLPVDALYRPGKPPYLFPELLTDANFTALLPGLLAPP